MFYVYKKVTLHEESWNEFVSEFVTFSAACDEADDLNDRNSICEDWYFAVKFV